MAVNANTEWKDGAQSEDAQQELFNTMMIPYTLQKEACVASQVSAVDFVLLDVLVITTSCVLSSALSCRVTSGQIKTTRKRCALMWLVKMRLVDLCHIVTRLDKRWFETSSVTSLRVMLYHNKTRWHIQHNDKRHIVPQVHLFLARWSHSGKWMHTSNNSLDSVINISPGCCTEPWLAGILQFTEANAKCVWGPLVCPICELTFWGASF